MKFHYLSLFIFLIVNVYSQTETFQLNQFGIAFSGKKMLVFEQETLVEERYFNNPSSYSVDLDGDSLYDFLVIDRIIEGTNENFIVYVFNTLDSFFLADSVFSGYFEPYFTMNEESFEMIIVSGNSRFLEMDSISRIALPINCYKFESGELLLINDELYDIFLQENEDILDFIQQQFENNSYSCKTSKQIISAISAAYANYINAGEPTLAHQLITKYYYCEDKESFIRKMDDLILN